MKTSWVKRFYRVLLLLGLVGAGVGLVGCADEYAAYPGYRGGYYANYGSAPYYGYGYPYGGYGAYGYPYRAYGPYYGYPSYGGASVVISGSRSSYTYRDRYGRLRTSRDVRRARGTPRRSRIQTPSTEVRRTDADDERRYYSRP